MTWLLRKLEPLGTEFKTVCCAITGVMMVMEIQRGKDGMQDIKYNREYGATAGCTMRLAEKSSQELYSTKDIVVGDAWFGSVTAAANLAAEGKDCCLQVKTNGEGDGNGEEDESVDLEEQRRKWSHMKSEACVMAFKDCNGVEHGMYKFPTTKGKSGKTYCKARRCVMILPDGEQCGCQTVYFCECCGPMCHKDADSHFVKHVQMIKKRRGRQTN